MHLHGEELLLLLSLSLGLCLGLRLSLCDLSMLKLSLLELRDGLHVLRLNRILMKQGG